MLIRLKPLWESVSNSLWFVPGLLTVAAIVLATLAVSAPFDIAETPGAFWWLHSGSAEHASNLLSSLLTSMITLATVAISITMVVLVLAAGQLGPRLIRAFMSDKRTQFLLGFLLATIVYLVLIFRLVGNDTREYDVPHLAVTIGTGLVLASVFVLQFFVHHLARSIVADTVIERVGRGLDLAIREMLPKAVADREEAGSQIAADSPGADLRLPRGGYVQAINYSRLVKFATQADAVIHLDFRPGNHLLPLGCHGVVRPGNALSDDLAKEIAEMIVLGDQPTAAQDLEFPMRQLVEVALRALSPGVNDPFTATTVLNRLGISIAHVMDRGTATGCWCDEDGIPRVTGKTTTFRGIVDSAFNQIRQAAEGEPSVLISLQATLANLAENVQNEEQRRVLTEHIGMVAATGRRSIDEPYDLQALEDRTSLARKRLGAA